MSASDGQTTEIYRWPANGKRLAEQKLAEVEMFFATENSWRGNQRERLLNQSIKGWFDETQDEISEEKALEFIAASSPQ